MRNIPLFVASVLFFLLFLLVRSAYPGFAYICVVISIILLFVALSFLPSSTMAQRVHPSQTRMKISPPPEPVKPKLSIPLTAQKAHASLTDQQFELFAAAVIIGGENRGYTFKRHCGKSGDKGVDVLLKDPFSRIICVQAKKYKIGNAVKSSQVREFSASIGTYRSHCGYLVTTSTLTRDGKVNRGSSMIWDTATAPMIFLISVLTVWHVQNVRFTSPRDRTKHNCLKGRLTCNGCSKRFH